jgi:tetratricopeptide (TPR) repeat protein
MLLLPSRTAHPRGALAICTLAAVACQGPSPEELAAGLERSFELLDLRAGHTVHLESPHVPKGVLGYQRLDGFDPYLALGVVQPRGDALPEAQGAYAELLELGAQAHHATPDDPDPLHMLGVVFGYMADDLPPDAHLARVRALDESEHLLRAALDRAPRDPSLRWGLALSYARRLGLDERASSDDALEAYRAYLKHHPDNLLVRRHLALAHYARGEHTEADKQLSKLLEQPSDFHRANPELTDAFAYSSRIAVARGDYDRAELLLREATQDWRIRGWAHDYYPGCPNQALGRVYRDLGQEDKASEHFVQGITWDLIGAEGALAQAEQALSRREWAAGMNLAQEILRVMGPEVDPATAVRHDITPNDAARLVARASVIEGFVLLLRGQFTAAMASFDSADALVPGHRGVTVGRAHVLISEGHDERGQALLAPILDWGEQGPPRLDDWEPLDWMVYRMALLGAGWAAANQNQPARALDHYQGILDRESEDIMALQGKAIALTAMKQLGQAEATFRHILELAPDDPYAMAELGLVAFNRGDDAGAIELFEAALERDGQRYTCPYEGLGLVALRQGRVEDAQTHFERAIEINPDIEYKKYNGLAKIHLQAGRPEQAIPLLEKSIENYPYDPEAAELLARARAARGD